MGGAGGLLAVDTDRGGEPAGPCAQPDLAPGGELPCGEHVLGHAVPGLPGRHERRGDGEGHAVWSLGGSGRYAEPEEDRWPSCRITLAGLPTATTSAGRFRTTTEPAPTTVLSPMLTPGHTITPPPSHTLSPIVIGSAASHFARRSAGCGGWV